MSSITINIPSPSVKSYLLFFLKWMTIFGWPIFVNWFSYVLMWDSIISRLTAAAIPMISLLVALLLSKFNKGKSICILISLIYCLVKAIWMVHKTIEIFNIHQMLEILKANSLFYSIFVLYCTIGFFALRYLWYTKNYKELFALYKITFFQGLANSSVLTFTRRFSRIINRLLGKSIVNFLKAIWKYRERVLILSCIPIVYFFWFKQYVFFPKNANASYYLDYLKIWLVPYAILLIALIAYKVRILKKSGVLLSTLAPITAGAYGIWHYTLYFKSFINLISVEKKDLIKTYHQFMNEPVSWSWMPDLLAIAAGICVIVKICRAPSRAKKENKSIAHSTNYGSAQFLDYQGIKKLHHPEGIPIGAFPRNINFEELFEVIDSIKKFKGEDLIRVKAQHITLIAPSRSGKGAGIIIPTLLGYNGPVFVTDIKGENYAVTKRARMAKGRKVYAFDPFDITGDVGVRINLLGSLDPESPEVANQAQALANILCPIAPNDSAEARHFKSQCQAVIECLSLYVLFSNEYEDKRNLRAVHDLICIAKDRFEETFKTIAENTHLIGGTISNIANRLLSIAEKERSSVFTTTHNCIRFLNSPRIAEATSHIGKCNTVLFLLNNAEEPKSIQDNTILLRKINENIIAYWKEHSKDIVKSLSEMAVNALYEILPQKKENWQSQQINSNNDEALVEKIATICGYGASDIKVSSILNGDVDLFICIPPQYLTAQENLLRLMFGMLISIMQQKNKKAGKDIRLLMLIDETPSLGYLPQIEQILSHGAGYGIHLMIISQTIGLLKGVYRQAVDTFLTNDLCLYFGCSDNETSQLVSSLLGKKTIEVSSSNEGTSTQKNSGQNAKGSSYSVSDSVSETGRDLLMPNEIRVLGNKVVLAFVSGQYPIICNRINYWERSEWAGMWDENPMHCQDSYTKLQYSWKEYGKMVLTILNS